MRTISRKGFLKVCVAGLVTLFFGERLTQAPVSAQEASASNARPKRGVKGDYDLVVAKGDDPYRATVKAVESMGGIERFVRKGDVVVIKPNIGWDRTPEQAANTNPLVVAALVDLSFKAGAKRVNIFDVPCNDPRRCYENSGIQKAAVERGAQVYFPDEWNTVKARFSYDSPMEGWPVLKDALECDTFINVPILKHHSLAGLTISMKNLMGVCTGNRGIIHTNIGRKLVDITDLINPDLTVVDAYRVLLRHGPSGGSLDDVSELKTIVVGTDPVLADAFGAHLMEKDPLSLAYIDIAVQRKLGSADIGKANILNVSA